MNSNFSYHQTRHYSDVLVDTKQYFQKTHSEIHVPIVAIQLLKRHTLEAQYTFARHVRSVERITPIRL
jgi:hypothetical protein